MVINASIPLQGQPVQPIQLPDATKQYLLLNQLQQAQQQRQLTDLAVQEAQQKRQDTVNLREAFQQYPNALTDPTQQTQFLSAVGRASPTTALQYQKSFREATTATLQQQKAQLEQHIQQVEFVGRLANGVTDQASYDRAKTLAAQSGLPIDQFPDVYDPALVQQFQAAALKASERLKAMHDQATLEETKSRNAQLASHERAQETQAKEQLAETARGHTLTFQAAREGHAATLQAARENRAAMEANLGQVVPTETGLVGVNTRTGRVTPIAGPGGEPVRGKLTENEGNALAFGLRAQEADQKARELEGKGVLPGVQTRLAESLPYGAGNYLLSADQQSYNQAKLQFAQAILRKESGAAINQDEYVKVDRTYFPQPGDAPSVLAQKQQARASAIDALGLQTGGRGIPSPTAPAGRPPIPPAPAGRTAPTPAPADPLGIR